MPFMLSLIFICMLKECVLISSVVFHREHVRKVPEDNLFLSFYLSLKE